MIVTELRLCGGPATGGCWVERGWTWRVAREDLTLLPREREGRRGRLMHGAAYVAVATTAERSKLRRAERAGRRDPRPWTTTADGRPVQRWSWEAAPRP